MSFTKNKKILLEEKLSGHELSTESIIYNDEIITFAVADRNCESSDIFLLISLKMVLIILLRLIRNF